MALFRRNKQQSTGADSLPAQDQAPEQESEPTRGPKDRSQVKDAEGRLDLGSIWLRGVAGMELRLEADRERQQVVGAHVVLGDSQMQIQVFAAPKTLGIWDEIRDEIAQSLATNGGTAEEVDGPLGTELHVRMASQNQSGQTVFSPIRFVGVDGPRWFFRAVMSGRAAIDAAAAERFYEIIDDIVVVRGDVPMPPREVLPLALPKSREQLQAEAAAAAEAAGEEAGEEGTQTDLDPFKRGPEITEIR
ncbi:MAG: DUF3710 domain-containing protein [Actinomycetales bacterium]|nr:DUF3710 domain-containing protein [Tetrasphaera sp.]NLW98300.1 DUF3710 domain-containing protein [Actinomycetales bacterium]